MKNMQEAKKKIVLLTNYKKTEVSQLQYTLKENTDPSSAYSRLHMFYTTDKDGKTPEKLGSVQIGALIFKNTNLGLWKYGNKWIVTKRAPKETLEKKDSLSYVL